MPEKNIREFYETDVTELSSTEFEKYCLEILSAYAEEEKLNRFSITHNVKIEAKDGTYQIDVLAEFYAMKSRFQILVECKQYKNPVSRDKVEILNSRLQSTGSQKGILMSTAGFQSGAIQYAKEHGIALVQIFNTHEKFRSYAPCNDYIDEYNSILLRYPLYCADSITDGKRIYPNSRMQQEIIDEFHSEK